MELCLITLARWIAYCMHVRPTFKHLFFLLGLPPQVQRWFKALLFSFAFLIYSYLEEKKGTMIF